MRDARIRADRVRPDGTIAPWEMPETDPAYLTAAALADAIEADEDLICFEREEHQRPDRALVWALRHRQRKLDAEIIRRDLGGC